MNHSASESKPPAAERTTRSRPSAPMPKWRSQRAATCSAERSSCPSGSAMITKSLPVPWPFVNEMGMRRVYGDVIPWYDELDRRIRPSSDVPDAGSRKDGFMITAENLTKRFGPHTAVDNVSFVARPGQVTGFLGPNG